MTTFLCLQEHSHDKFVLVVFAIDSKTNSKTKSAAEVGFRLHNSNNA